MKLSYFEKRLVYQTHTVVVAIFRPHLIFFWELLSVKNSALSIPFYVYRYCSSCIVNALNGLLALSAININSKWFHVVAY